MEEVKEIQEVKELTDEQKEQSRQLKAYIESYKKAHTPWRRVDVKKSDISNSYEKYGDEKHAPIYKKIGRNERCTCGSGRKVKNCCGVQTRYYLQDGKSMDI